MDREAVITRLISIVSLFPKGASLRQRLYRRILHHMGEFTYIQEGVEIVGAKSIEMGDSVCVLRGTHISAEPSDTHISIGNNVIIRRGVEIEAVGKGRINIGDRTFISSNAWILGVGDIAIGKDCLISPNVGIVGTNRHYQDSTRPINTQGGTAMGITIGDDCWLGHGVSVMDGVTIGQGRSSFVPNSPLRPTFQKALPLCSRGASGATSHPQEPPPFPVVLTLRLTFPRAWQQFNKTVNGATSIVRANR